jgi:hypothetical protein
MVRMSYPADGGQARILAPSAALGRTSKKRARPFLAAP